MKYRIFIDENASYMNEAERRLYGEFDSVDEALAAAKALVDEDIRSFYKDGMTPPDEVFLHYTTFGVDPFIISAGEKVDFSAWTYAKARCEELFDKA